MIGNGVVETSLRNGNGVNRMRLLDGNVMDINGEVIVPGNLRGEKRETGYLGREKREEIFLILVMVVIVAIFSIKSTRKIVFLQIFDK
jgi:hypothetical protein